MSCPGMTDMETVFFLLPPGRGEVGRGVDVEMYCIQINMLQAVSYKRKDIRMTTASRGDPAVFVSGTERRRLRR